MGNCCNPNNQTDYSQSDLAAPIRFHISDSLERYVASLPFPRTQILNYLAEVDQIEANMMTQRMQVDNVVVAFKTPAWASFFNQKSNHQLVQAVFETRKNQDELYDQAKALKTLGILWCYGNDKEKAYSLAKLCSPKQMTE